MCGYRRKRSGFSLIELLVVMAIIAILAGLLVPAIDYIMKLAKRAAIRTDIANLENALQAYKLVYAMFPPDGQDLGGVPNEAKDDVVALGGCNSLTSGECLVYFLGNTFKTSPDTTKLEVYAKKSGGEHMDHFSKQQLKDYDSDIPIPANKTAYYAGEEFTDLYFVRYHYDLLNSDDPDPSDDGTFYSGQAYVSQGQEATIADPREAAGEQGQNKDFDIWSAGPDPTDPLDDVTNWSE